MSGRKKSKGARKSRLNFRNPSNVVSYVRLTGSSNEGLKNLISEDTENPGKLCIHELPFLKLTYEQPPDIIINLPIHGLRSVDKNKSLNKSLILHFSEAEEYEYSIEFEFPSGVMFEIFRKSLLSIIKALDATFTPPPIENRSLVERESSQSSRRGTFAISQSRGSANSNADLFYEIPAADWSWSHVQKWLKHVFCQISYPDGRIEKIKIVTLFQILKSRSLVHMLKDYFSVEGHNIYFLHNQLVKQMKHQTRGEEDDDDEIDYRIVTICEHQSVGVLLIEALEELKSLDWKFSIARARVLPKIVELQTLRQQPGKEIDLKRLKRSLILDETNRSFWDASTCRRRILSMLVWGSGIQERIEYLEKEFQKFYNNNNEEDEEEEGEENYYFPDYELFEKSLLEFNSKHRCHLHRLSFKILTQTKRNQYVKQRAKLVGKFQDRLKEGEELRKELALMERKKAESDMKVKNLTEQMILSESDEEQIKFEEELSEAEKSSRELKIKIQDLQSGLDDDSEDLRIQEEIKALNEQILACGEKKYDTQKEKFFLDPRRDELIDEMLRASLQDKHQVEETRKQQGRAGKGMNFDVLVRPKLVLARTNSSLPPKVASGLMSYVLDPLASPSFFQFGFLHSGLSFFRFAGLKEQQQQQEQSYPREKLNLYGCSIHWFSTSLISVLPHISLGEPYDEIVNLDLGLPPYLLNYRTLVNRVHKIAEKIVRYNLNYKYSDFNLMDNIKGKKVVNCQEVTEEIISKTVDPSFSFNSNDDKDDESSSCTLGYVLRKWIERMKQISMDKKKIGDVDKLRLLFVKDINISWRKRWCWIQKKTKKKMKMKKFEEIFKPVLKGSLFSQKDGLIVFKTHQDLDRFYLGCRDVDEDFEYNFPDVCRLLKAFDDAFWMKLNIEPGRKKCIEAEEGCPFKI